MFKGTTPSLILTFDDNFDVDFSDARSVVVTFSTDYRKVILEKADEELTIDGNTITIDFTQEETLSFTAGKMLIQVNAYFDDGTRICSDIQKITWEDNLKNEVMT